MFSFPFTPLDGSNYVSPLRTCRSPNSWYLPIWPYFEIGSLQRESNWGQWGGTWSNMTDVLKRRGKCHMNIQTTKRRWEWEDSEGHWSLCHKSKNTWRLWDCRRLWMTPTKILEEGSPCPHLGLDFYPSEPWENTFLLFKTTKFVVLCYESQKKLFYSPSSG